MSKPKTTKEIRQEAELLVDEIQGELTSVKKAVNESLGQLQIATATKSEFRKLVPLINRTSKSTNTALTKIRNDRDRLSKLLTTVNSFYNKKYLPLVDKLNDPSTGIKARIKEGDKFEKELQNVKVKYEKQIHAINLLATDFKKKLNDLKKIGVTIRGLNERVIDSEQDISKKRIKIEEDIVKIDLSISRISDSEKNIIETEKAVIKLQKECEIARKDIEEWHSEANDTLVKIRNIYEIAMGTGLGGEFDKRRKTLEDESTRWRVHLFFTTIALFTAILALFILQLYPVDWDITKLKFDSNFYARFLITSPFIFYLFFVTGQYNKNKLLLEKYAYKTALALSIEAHITLLLGVKEFNHEANINKIIDFILSGFDKIYEAPYEKDKKKRIKIDTDKIVVELIDQLKKKTT